MNLAVVPCHVVNSSYGIDTDLQTQTNEGSRDRGNALIKQSVAIWCNRKRTRRTSNVCRRVCNDQ